MLVLCTAVWHTALVLQGQLPVLERQNDVALGLPFLVDWLRGLALEHGRHRLGERRRAQLDLRSKLIRVMTKVEKLHHWGKPTTQEDMKFRECMNGLMAELHVPHRYRGQMDELQSQLDYRPDLQMGALNDSVSRQHVGLTKMDLERVYEFLRRQQEGLAKLNEIVRKDLRDLDIMRSRSLALNDRRQ